jgi:transposase
MAWNKSFVVVVVVTTLLLPGTVRGLDVNRASFLTLSEGATTRRIYRSTGYASCQDGMGTWLHKRS